MLNAHGMDFSYFTYKYMKCEDCIHIVSVSVSSISRTTIPRASTNNFTKTKKQTINRTYSSYKKKTRDSKISHQCDLCNIKVNSFVKFYNMTKKTGVTSFWQKYLYSLLWSRKRQNWCFAKSVLFISRNGFFFFINNNKHAITYPLIIIWTKFTLYIHCLWWKLKIDFI